MFVSNENNDWIYLVKTPPVNTTILRHTMNVAQSNENTSFYQTELEQAQDDDITILSDESSTCLFEQTYDSKNDCHNQSILSEHVKLNSNENNAIIKTLSTDRTLFSSSENNLQQNCANNQLKSSDNSSNNIERNVFKNEFFISSTCLIILICLSFLFGQIIIQWNQVNMNKLANELERTNQHLNEIKRIPIGKFEQKLIKQFDKQLQIMFTEQLNILSQMNDLKQTLNKTKANMTNTISQLNKENVRLKEQIKFLKSHFNMNSNRIHLTLKQNRTQLKFFDSHFKQIVQSINFSKIFKNIHDSIKFVRQYYHEYFNRNKTKFNQFSYLTSNQIQSYQQMKLTYPLWIQSKQKFTRQYTLPFQQRHICSLYPMKKLCSMTNWMIQFF